MTTISINPAMDLTPSSKQNPRRSHRPGDLNIDTQPGFLFQTWALNENTAFFDSR
jgi:hypothetical protein